MGVGRPQDLIVGASCGIDMFDCVMPTRNARNGQLFTSKGKLNIKNLQFAEDKAPIDETCDCYTCRHFSRAYLRHLFQAGEMLSAILNSIHNIHYYLALMKKLRSAIAENRFDLDAEALYNFND